MNKAEMMARVEQIQGEWLLLGFRVLEGELATASAKLPGTLPPGSLVPTYMCMACSRQQVTVVTASPLPAACPKCHAPLTAPSEATVSDARRDAARFFGV